MQQLTRYHSIREEHFFRANDPHYNPKKIKVEYERLHEQPNNHMNTASIAVLDSIAN